MGCCSVEMNRGEGPKEVTPVSKIRRKRSYYWKGESNFLKHNFRWLCKTIYVRKNAGKRNNDLGQYGETYEGIHISTKQKRAIKAIKKAALDGLQINQNDIMSEYNVLKKLVKWNRIIQI